MLQKQKLAATLHAAPATRQVQWYKGQKPEWFRFLEHQTDE
jgi:hypothetical protein